MVSRRAFVRGTVPWAACAAALPPFAGAGAQSYPSRPLTLVVPFPPGGPTDTVGRVMAEGVRASLGQQVIVDNVAGASGSLGAGRVARAAPDGYTFVVGSLPTMVINGAVLALPYDVANDFQPVGLIATNPMMIVGRRTLPAGDVKELIGWLRANPGRVTAGTGGIGAISHVAAVYLEREIGARFQLVSYRGLAPALQDLAGGQIDLLIDYAANALAQVRAGNVKAFAVTAPQRMPSAPDIPAADEAGLRGFHLSAWHAFFLPAATPRDVALRLNRATLDALASAQVKARLAAIGQEIYPTDQQTPQALAAFHRAEIDRWWPVLRAAGVTAR